MININLFERKQINRLPYLIGSGFLILSLILTLYLFGARQYYIMQDSQNMQKIEQQREAVQEARRLELLNTQIGQSESNIQEIAALRHTIPFLFEDIHANLPANAEHITSFNLTADYEILLSLYDMNYDELTSLIEKLDSIDYVTSVQLVTLTKTPDSENLYTSEITIILDQTMLREAEYDEI